MANCTICGKPVILVPSAIERARKDGYEGAAAKERAKFYISLFTSHSDCFIQKRSQESVELMRASDAKAKEIEDAKFLRKL